MHFSLPARLKKARKAAGKTGNALSVTAGLSGSTVAHIEAGAAPQLDTAERIARALGLSPGFLAYGTGPETSERSAGPLACEECGARLAQLRRQRGLSLRALAEQAEMTPTAISNIEEGRSMPTVATAEALAKALGVAPAWLAYGEGL